MAPTSESVAFDLHQDDSPFAALHVEHIIPKIHGGSDDVENLAGKPKIDSYLIAYANDDARMQS